MFTSCSTSACNISMMYPQIRCCGIPQSVKVINTYFCMFYIPQFGHSELVLLMMTIRFKVSSLLTSALMANSCSHVRMRKLASSKYTRVTLRKTLADTIF